MSYWTDTHAHIYLGDFDPDRSDMMERCRDNSVKKIFMPNIDHTSIDRMMEVEMKYAGHCISMMGLHPCSVKKDFEKELYQVEQWLSKRKFSAIGEMGTDLYWDKTFWEQQKEAFKVQVGWALKLELPIILHTRESIDETIELLQPYVSSRLTGIFHCFSGTLEQAQKITGMGFFLGIGGVATFKNGGLDAVLPELGIDKIVLETDSPYLAPVPFRGKRNEPSYIPIIAKKISELTKFPVEEVQSITNSNAEKVFNNN